MKVAFHVRRYVMSQRRIMSLSPLGFYDSAARRWLSRSAASSSSRLFEEEKQHSLPHHSNLASEQDDMGRRFVTVSVVVATCVVVYYFTTASVTLTTDPSPYKNTMFHHFACDYAVISNKWTGTRVVISLEDELEKEKQRREAAHQQALRLGEAADSSIPIPPAPITLTRILKVNKLLGRVHCYLQKKTSLVIVDITNELEPDRFMRVKQRTGDIDSMERSKIGARRTLGEQRSSIKREPAFLQFRSVLRPRDVPNGYQMGQLPKYESTVRTVSLELLSQRYRNLLLQQLHSPSVAASSLSSELLAEGVVGGSTITASDAVGDPTAFCDDVKREVTKRLGDDVLLYDFSLVLKTSAC